MRVSRSRGSTLPYRGHLKSGIWTDFVVIQMGGHDIRPVGWVLVTHIYRYVYNTSECEHASLCEV